MKNLLLLFLTATFFSCNNSKNDAEAPEIKVVCADSFEQELFDENGNSYIVRMPGDCDTVEVKEANEE